MRYNPRGSSSFDTPLDSILSPFAPLETSWAGPKGGSKGRSKGGVQGGVQAGGPRGGLRRRVQGEGPKGFQGGPKGLQGGVQSGVQGGSERSPSGFRGGSKQRGLMKSKEEGGPRKGG